MRRWSSSSRKLAALGAMLGVLAFLLMRSYAGRERALEAGLGRPATVVVASRDVARGSVLTSADLATARWPSAYVPADALRDRDSATGRVLLAGLAKGELVTSSRLAPKGGIVASLIPSGLRAVALPSTLSPDAVTPGDHVDVLATFAGARAHVETVATELEVLRVLAGNDAGSGSQGDTGGSGITLLVLASPSQAQELAYARAFAAISIALDGPEEVVPAS